MLYFIKVMLQKHKFYTSLFKLFMNSPNIILSEKKNRNILFTLEKNILISLMRNMFVYTVFIYIIVETYIISFNVIRLSKKKIIIKKKSYKYTTA